MARYLELNELVIGEYYSCSTYDGLDIICKYTGEGNFEDEDYTYSIFGDIRYVRVLEKDYSTEQ